MRVSPLKLGVLSILTLGLYELYWFYKNWKLARDEGGAKVRPFWRAIFAIFFAPSLFVRIHNSAKAIGLEPRSKPGAARGPGGGGGDRLGDGAPFGASPAAANVLRGWRCSGCAR